MSDNVDVTLTPTGDGWWASLAYLEGLPAAVGTGATALAALDAARELAQGAALAEALAQGLTVGPGELSAIEAHLRLACSSALFALENPAPLPPPVPTWGADVSTFPDLDVTFSLMTTQRVIAEVVARRLVTPKGGLFYDPSSGVDVRDMLGQGFTPAQVYALRSRIASEAEEDERVQSAEVSLAFNERAQTMRITVRIEPVDAGPFDLVLNVTKLAVDLSVLNLA